MTSVEDMRRTLLAGADKVSVNTAAVRNPQFITEGADAFGRQCVVVAIDAKRVYEDGGGREVVKTEEGKCWWEVHIEGGRTATGKDAVRWASEAEGLGAGEILLTSMDYDGTQDGYDLELTTTVSRSTRVPIIASGGAGSPAHLLQVLTEGEADAALAASIFHRNIYSVMQVKEFLREKGVPVRI